MYENIKNHIRNVPDFPKKGILFKDITPALENAEIFAEIINAFYELLKDKKIDKIASIDARGYLFGAPLAYKLGCGLVLVRKAGKLPAETLSETYDLEYGKAIIEVHKDAVNKGEKVLIVDDLLATGGTTKAACRLLQKLGADIVANVFLIELSDLGGRKVLEEFAPTISLLQY